MQQHDANLSYLSNKETDVLVLTYLKYVNLYYYIFQKIFKIFTNCNIKMKHTCSFLKTLKYYNYIAKIDNIISR